MSGASSQPRQEMQLPVEKLRSRNAVCAVEILLLVQTRNYDRNGFFHRWPIGGGVRGLSRRSPIGLQPNCKGSWPSHAPDERAAPCTCDREARARLRSKLDAEEM